jgi:hypothetical protein
MTPKSGLSGCDESLQYNFTKYLILGIKVDNKCTSGKFIAKNHSINIHGSFGFGYIQPDSNSQTWYVESHKIRTISAVNFTKDPTTLQDQLVEVFELSQ